MKSVRYSRYTGEDFGLSAEDLLRALSDFFLESGFNNPYMQFSEFNEHSLDELKRAIEEALQRGDFFDPERAEQIKQKLESMSEEEMDQLLGRLVQKLVDEGYINTEQQAGGVGQKEGRVDVKITDKSVDFLGFKTLKDLLGSLGHASFGAHDTRDLATGVETTGAAKQYEFGDTMNLDVCQTLFTAMQREGVKIPLNLEYEDLHVHQSEYQSSCATVLMLDCSHSMILYGEDRFTPAKKVALALSHLIRTQYPGDSLRCVLFHDSAEELRIEDLARVQVGPYYTNTREGLILAQRLLNQEAPCILRRPGFDFRGPGRQPGLAGARPFPTPARQPSRLRAQRRLAGSGCRLVTTRDIRPCRGLPGLAWPRRAARRPADRAGTRQPWPGRTGRPGLIRPAQTGQPWPTRHRR